MASAPLTRDEQLAAFYQSFLAKRYRRAALEELEREQRKASKKPVATARATGSSLDGLAYHLDDRYCHLLPKGNHLLQQDFVRRSLAKYKPTSCYVLSEGERYDQQYLSVAVAIEEIVSLGTTSLVLFVPGQAAYLEGHEPGEQYLCLRGGNS